MIRYYVTDRRHADVVACAERAVQNGVDMIQIREKDLPSRDLLELVARVQDAARGTPTKVLVNDRVDIALATGIEGVQLPGNGLPARIVRPLVRVLGVSIHSCEEALEAEAARADFVVFGPVFATPGKTAVGLGPLRSVVSSVKIPVIAIGGITMANAEQVLQTGAMGIAGIRLFQMD
jgi:thiamine-phosphate pyrophosphorylase